MRRKPQASRPGFGLVLPEERQAESRRKGQECGPLWLAWKVESPSSVAHDLVERLQGGAVPVVAVRGDALPIGAVAEQTELLGEVLASGALPDLRENPLVHLCPSPDLGHSAPEVVTSLPLPDLRAGVPLSIHFVFEDPGNAVQA